MSQLLYAFRIDQSPGATGVDRKMKPGASPLKKEMGMVKRSGAIASSKADILTAADGPRSSMNAANVENSLFNKHYNKELKLCEGTFNLISLTYQFFRRNPYGAARA